MCIDCKHVLLFYDIATIDQMYTLNFLAHHEPDGYGPLFYEEEEREYGVEEDNTIEQKCMLPLICISKNIECATMLVK